MTPPDRQADTGRADKLSDPMVPMPDKGRIYRDRRRVRLADADARGRLRLDGCARYLQDLGNDDTAESGLDDHAGPWVVRRAVVDVFHLPRWGQQVTLATWCGGTGSRWAERRLSLHTDTDTDTDTDTAGSVAVEMETLWVHLDPDTLVPAKLPDWFVEAYGDAADGRRISSKLLLETPERPDELPHRPWPLRVTDIDLMRHVNNAAYWAAIEEVAAGHPLRRAPFRAVLEYGSGIPADSQVELLVDDDQQAGRLSIWFSMDGTIAASARLTALPAGVR